MDKKANFLSAIYVVLFLTLNVLTAQLIFSSSVNRFISPFEFHIVGFVNSILSDLFVLIVIIIIGLFIFKKRNGLFLYLLIITFLLNVAIITLYVYSMFFNSVFALNLAVIDQPSSGFEWLVTLSVLRTVFINFRILFSSPFFILLIFYIVLKKASIGELELILTRRKKLINLFHATVINILTIFIRVQIAINHPTSNLIDPALFSVAHGGLYSFYIQTAIGLNPTSEELFTTEELEAYIEKFNTNSPNWDINIEEEGQMGLLNGQNLFLIQLESFSSFFIGQEFNGIEVTPFLNSLIEDQIYFSNVMQSVGLGNTNDAELAVLTGLFGKSNDLVLHNMALDYQAGNDVLDVAALPRLFAENSFHTSFFHGNISRFYNRNISHYKLGFESLNFAPEFLDSRNVQSTRELEDTEVYGNFGWISDKAMLDFALEYTKEILNDSRKPDNFFTFSVLVQPHAPFHRTSYLPSNNWGRNVRDPQLINYLDRILYLDGILEDFMTRAMKELPDTLFILYSDHGPIVRGQDFRSLVDANSTIEETYALFQVPVFFIDNTKDNRLLSRLEEFRPYLKIPRSQRDIFRTVVNLWNFWQEAEYVFGVNMFSDKPSIVFEGRLNYFMTENYFTNLRNTQRRLDFNTGISIDYINKTRNIVLKHRMMNAHFINTRRN